MRIFARWQGLVAERKKKRVSVDEDLKKAWTPATHVDQSKVRADQLMGESQPAVGGVPAGQSSSWAAGLGMRFRQGTHRFLDHTFHQRDEACWRIWNCTFCKKLSFAASMTTRD